MRKQGGLVRIYGAVGGAWESYIKQSYSSGWTTAYWEKADVVLDLLPSNSASPSILPGWSPKQPLVGHREACWSNRG